MTITNEKQECRVWVGHIPDGIRPADLRDKFEKFGELSDIKFVRRGRDEHYAFLQYGSVDEAKDAISQMNDSDVFGGKIEVKPANPTQKSEEERDRARNRNLDRNGRDDRRDNRRDDRRRSPSPRGRRRSVSPPPRESNSGKYRVEVSNLPDDMTWQELKRLASDYGKSVCFTRTQRDYRQNIVNGIVEYSDKRDAENLISSLDGKRMEGGDKRLSLRFEKNDDVIARPGNRRRRSGSRSPRRRSRSRSNGRSNRH